MEQDKNLTEGRGQPNAGGAGHTAAAAPDPEVAAVARRRTFTVAYKQQIVRDANACKTPGAVGELLRREGLYASLLSKWRQEAAAAEAAVLLAKRRGPKPDPAKAAGRHALHLEQEIARLRKKLGRAEQIIDAQKKLCDLLDLPVAEEVL